ncbi:Fe-Mn family superoxide dismutase [[Emmonsia] crescens]|uniref:Superoxide dismutase n=1 Tax=[Emmonsia] crescens TaxID=73230 RepID=A0A2B7Z6U0_9EURO|nr:Fe-Mn family superoxide dismutase [Emmonsia crescens]
MAASVFRSTVGGVLRAGAVTARSNTAAMSGTAGARLITTKATLPDLKYDYGALEPSISGKIMELHHKKHHQTYVNSYNDAVEKLAAAQEKADIKSQVALQFLTNFHGGGHVNHSLFWENLAPKSAGGGEPPSGSLGKAVEDSFGSYDEFKSKFNTALAGIQGSGWAWLVKDKQTGKIAIKTYANQDPVVGQFTPLLGIDAWEHAYYLQYENRKAEYFSAVWDVVNWKAAEKRFA